MVDFISLDEKLVTGRVIQLHLKRCISYCGAMGFSIAMLVFQTIQTGSNRRDGSLGIVKLLLWHSSHLRWPCPSKPQHI